MWYLQQPTKKELDEYVRDISAKIKATRAYNIIKPFFECNVNGRRHDYVDELLRALPQDQLALNSQLESQLYPNPNNILGNDYIRKKVQSTFNYDRFISQDADFSYALSKVKKINVCPYCNRQYTLTIEKKTRAGVVVAHIAKPHFDHWFAKSTFPLLALSFYNLIPSCAVCNSSIKGNKMMALNNHVHPYCQQAGYEPHFKFRLLFKGAKDYELYTSKSIFPAEEQMKEDFFIEDAYRYHEDLEIADLVNLYLAHEGTYLKKWMKDTLKDLQPEKSLSEIVRMVFGAEIDAAKLKNRPLSKLKKDLLEQFHIIDKNGNVHPEFTTVH